MYVTYNDQCSLPFFFLSTAMCCSIFVFRLFNKDLTISFMYDKLLEKLYT